MATSIKTKKNSSVDTQQTTVADAKVEAVSCEDESKSTETSVKKERKYTESEGIKCRSIAPGKLYMTGIKSRIVYRWTSDGDVVEVEYQDLVAAIRSNTTYITAPFFIIEDKEFVDRFPQVAKIYETLYSIGDLRSVLLELRPNDMKSTILSLPAGAQDSIKHLASQMISNGTLDSVQKIKILDQIFGTELMLMTGLFGD